MSVVIHELPSRIRSRIVPLIKEARDRQRRRRLWMAVIAVAVCLLAIGTYGLSRASGSHAQAVCASGQCAGAMSGAAPVPNPCALITNAEARKFLGHPVQYKTADTMRGTSDGTRTCTWTAVPFSNSAYNGNLFTVVL